MDYKVKRDFVVVDKNEKEAVIDIIYDDKTTERKIFQVLSTDDIKQMISVKQDICINNKYINGFSYADQNLWGNVLINFTAENSIFDGDTSFSNAVFSGAVSFANTMFGQKGVSFNDTNFGEGSVSFEGATFVNGYVNFKRTRFGNGNISFRQAKLTSKDMVFSHALFGKGDVLFDRASFSKGYVLFNNTHFGKGRVSFSGSTFSGGSVAFKNSEFGNGDVYFKNADFGKEDVCFKNVRFNKGDLSFTGAKFGEGEIRFDHVIFGEGDVFFDDVEFKKSRKVCFKDTVFGEGNISFNRLNIDGGELHFINTSFASSMNKKMIISGSSNEDSCRAIFFMDCVIPVSIILSIRKISKVSFKNCTNSGVIDLRTMEPNGIKQLSFMNFHNLGAIYLNWDSLKKSLELPRLKSSDSMLADEMKMLKENFHNQGNYDWEDEAYVQYMNHHCMTLSSPKRQLLRLFGMIGGYGTKPLNVFLWMFGVVLFFGIMYKIMGPDSITLNVASYKNWSPFYYSAITFLTVGYGDLAARNGFAALLAGIEGFMGVFLMSYFSVSLVRKTLR